MKEDKIVHDLAKKGRNEAKEAHHCAGEERVEDDKIISDAENDDDQGKAKNKPPRTVTPEPKT